MNLTYDAVVIGGGIMGCNTALNLARGGMKVAVAERRGLCMAASGVNVGTLTLHTHPVSMVPYHRRSIEMWKNSADWLADVGVRERGGITVAFTDEEIEMLATELDDRNEAGAPTEIIDTKRIQQIDPAISERIRFAYYCPLDGYADSNLTGRGFHNAFDQEGVDIRLGHQVSSIEPVGDGFAVRIGEDTVNARRIVVAAGAWVRELISPLGLEFPPATSRLITMASATERQKPTLRSMITSVSGGLTLKQPDSGTYLIAGGWQGLENPIGGNLEVTPQSQIGNLSMACYVMPALRDVRVIRSWSGMQIRLSNPEPMAGALPGLDGAYIIGGFFSGWTAGPFMGHLLAQSILGDEPEMPLFDPARVLTRVSNTAAAADW